MNKNSNNPRLPIESEMVTAFISGKVKFPPIRFSLVEPAEKLGTLADAVIDVRWRGSGQYFVVKAKSSARRSTIEQAVANAKAAAEILHFPPMVIVPYLNEKLLNWLLTENISGLDLCGNGVITSPALMLIYRTGQPNRYASLTEVRLPYRGKYALVARALAVHPIFSSVTDIVEEIGKLGGQITQPTVSKALDALVDDLVIVREGRNISVSQLDLLIDNLVKNYRPQRPRVRITLKIEANDDAERIMILADKATKTNQRVMVTGVGSAGLYSVYGRDAALPMYCEDAASLASLGSTESRFPNIELIEIDDDSVYFDQRLDGAMPWASPIQSYLEMMAGGARERDAASQIYSVIQREAEQYIRRETEQYVRKAYGY